MSEFTTSQQEENALIRNAVNYTLPPPPKSKNPYQPDKRSKPEDWQKRKP